LALGAASCATPSIDRYLLSAEAGAEPARLKGAHGYLSQDQSRAILESLGRKSPDAGLLERHAAIEEALSGNPLSVGNRVTLREDGAETYRSMLAAIAAARNHIHLETYIFEDGDTGTQFAEALVARAKAGVNTRHLRFGGLVPDAEGILQGDGRRRRRAAGIQSGLRRGRGEAASIRSTGATIARSRSWMAASRSWAESTSATCTARHMQDRARAARRASAAKPWPLPIDHGATCKRASKDRE
jgi:hypothetical protein